MAISFVSHSKQSNSDPYSASNEVVIEANKESAVILKSPVVQTDEFNTAYNSFADASAFVVNNQTRPYYRQFQEGYGKYLFDFAHKFDEASKLSGNDRDYQETRLRAEILSQFASVLGQDLDCRMFLEAANHYHRQNIATKFIGSSNYMDDALETLRLAFNKANLSFGGITIQRRDSKGNPNGQISLAEVFSSSASLKKYIQDPKVREALLNIYDNNVAPELNKSVAEKEKKASEEVKSLALPTYGLAIPYVTFAAIKNTYDLANGPSAFARTKALGIANKVIRDGITKTDVGAATELVAEKITKVYGKKLTEKATQKLATEAVKKAAYTQLQRTASTGLLGTLFKGSNALGRGISVAGRFLGLAGGPWTMVLTIAAPIIFEIVMAEGKDLLNTMQGKKVETTDDWVDHIPLINGLGDWLGGCSRSYAKAFNLA